MVRYDPRVVVAESGKHVMDIVVPCYMTDSMYRMKPSSFMSLAQEMAMSGAEILGFGYDDLFPTYHMGWVLSRFHFKFLKPVMWRDAVQVRTWHKGVQSVFYVRDFQIVDENDEALVIGTSSWVILNMESRSLVKMTELPPVVSTDPQLTESAIEELAPKVAMPRKYTPEHVCDHVVVYSDLDINGHTNNVRYIDWAMDCISPDVTLNSPVKEVFINFNKETRVGDVVALNVLEESEGEDRIFIVEGTVEGKQSFIAKLVF